MGHQRDGHIHVNRSKFRLEDLNQILVRSGTIHCNIGGKTIGEVSRSQQRFSVQFRAISVLCLLRCCPGAVGVTPAGHEV